MIPPLLHPAERYMRSRIWEGVTSDDLLYEMTHGLQYPLVQEPVKDAVTGKASFWGPTPEVYAILETSRKDPALEPRSVSPSGSPVVAFSAPAKPGNRKRGRGTAAPKVHVSDFLDVRPSNLLSDEEYAARWGMEVRGASDLPRLLALHLWSQSEVRELTQALLALGRTPEEVHGTLLETKPHALQIPRHLESVLRKGPSVPSALLGPECVEAFAHYLWDVTGLTPTRKESFFAGRSFHRAALSSGFRQGPAAFEFQARLRSDLGKALTDLERLQVARDVAYLRIDLFRSDPAAFDAKAFTAAYTVMTDAMGRLSGLLTQGAEEVSPEQLRAREEMDFVSYHEILQDATLASDEALLERAFQNSGLSIEEYKALRTSVTAGQELSPEIRLRLSKLELDKMRSSDMDDPSQGMSLIKAPSTVKLFQELAAGDDEEEDSPPVSAFDPEPEEPFQEPPAPKQRLGELLRRQA